MYFTCTLKPLNPYSAELMPDDWHYVDFFEADNSSETDLTEYIAERMKEVHSLLLKDSNLAEHTPANWSELKYSLTYDAEDYDPAYSFWTDLNFDCLNPTDDNLNEIKTAAYLYMKHGCAVVAYREHTGSMPETTDGMPVEYADESAFIDANVESFLESYGAIEIPTMYLDKQKISDDKCNEISYCEVYGSYYVF